MTDQMIRETLYCIQDLILFVDSRVENFLEAKNKELPLQEQLSEDLTFLSLMKPQVH
jgi:hypothetical protein